MIAQKRWKLNLLPYLVGEKSLRDWPKKGDKGLRQRVYQKLKSGDIYALKEIHDLTVQQPRKRIVATNCIVVKKSKISQLVETKGNRAKNGENRCLKFTVDYRVEPFQNKALSGQSDLVSMVSMQATIGSVT